MFNVCDAEINGERWFLNTIKDKINVIFDVGSNSESIYTDFRGDVHYFDPVQKFIDNLKNKPKNNRNSYYNVFGLGEKNSEINYYPKYESFYDRFRSCQVSDDCNKIVLNIRKGKDYMIENNIINIDFLKIDTEGYELMVLKGFEEKLSNVNIIQFEYGGTFLDNNTKLIDVVDYLKSFGFQKFSYLSGNCVVPITDFSDHYQYCNIVCINKNSPCKPF